ncbi:MAG: hypothetical protein HY985_14360 [Magnetospirillum sp.]|nr:hypothetical protein [Magnetospirillum sp.]
MPACPHPFARLDAAERRWDGPIPRPAAQDGTGRRRLFARLAGETRRAVAERRRDRAAAVLRLDRRLEALVHSLAAYRHAAAAAEPPQPRMWVPPSMNSVVPVTDLARSLTR